MHSRAYLRTHARSHTHTKGKYVQKIGLGVVITNMVINQTCVAFVETISTKYDRPSCAKLLQRKLTKHKHCFKSNLVELGIFEKLGRCKNRC